MTAPLPPGERRWPVGDGATGRPGWLLSAPAEDAEATWRLRRDHRLLESLAHPHLAAAWLLVRDPATESWLRVQEALAPVEAPTPEALRDHVVGWLRGLAHVHAAGHVHGALGPAALGLGADGVPKLADAGRGWRVGQLAEGPAGPEAAPEVRGHARVDARADLHALGVCCRRWLVGDDVAAIATLPAPWPDLLATWTHPVPSRRPASAAAALGVLGVDVGPGPATLGPFSGRRDELAELLFAADGVVAAGKAAAVRVTGAPGVGKSRLLEEFRQRLAGRGFAVVVGRGGDAPAGTPFGAWLGVLATLIARAPAHLAATVAPVLTPLASTVAPTLEPRATMLRLHDAVTDLLAGSAGAGLVLCLDDWHMADEASRLLLAHVVRTVAAPVCVVLAGAPEGPAAMPEVCLDPLAAVAPLAGLHLAALATLGPAAREVARAAAVAGPGAGTSLLATVAALDPGDGRGSDEAVLDALGELAAAGILRHGGGGSTLEVPAAAVLAEVPAAALGAMHARALSYWRVMAQLGAGVPAPRLAGHALGALAAGATPRVLEAGAWYATAAARASLGVFALAEAARWLRRADDCMAKLADQAPVDGRLALAGVAGDLARYQARGPEAEAHYRMALELAGGHAPEAVAGLRVGLAIALNLQSLAAPAGLLLDAAVADPVAPPETHARALAARARHHVRQGRPGAARADCEALLDQRDAPVRHRVEALGILGLVATGEPGGTAPGLAHLEEARGLAAAAGDRLALASTCMLAGNARLAVGQLPAARGEFERFYLLATALGLPDEVVCASLNLAQVAYDQGRYAQARDRARAGADSAGENRVYRSFALAKLAVACAHLGQLAEAENALALATEAARPLGAHGLAPVALARLEVALFLGRLGRAEEIGLALTADLADEALAELRAPHALLMGQLYNLSRETGLAVAHFHNARTLAVTAGNLHWGAAAALGQAQVAVRVGQLAVAKVRASEALDWARPLDAHPVVLGAHVVLARAAWGLGDRAGAVPHLKHADAVAAKLATPDARAQAWMALARYREDGATYRARAQIYWAFYMNQLPPRARQEFLNGPMRRDAFTGRGTTPLPGLRGDA